MSSSRELTVVGKPKPKANASKEAKAEKVGAASEKIIPPVEVLRIHPALLLAAESTTGSPDPKRPFIHGLNLVRREKTGRVAATDGDRMFVGSWALENPMPSWLKEGITLSSEGLRKRVQLLMGVSDAPLVKVSHTKGAGYVTLSDERDEAMFRIEVLNCTYPDYERVLGASSFVALDEDGQPKGREWEPVGINSRYLKHCGEIAKTLEAGIEKKWRPPNGMVIRAYNSGTSDAPLVFGFDGWPGAILITMPAKLANSSIAKETAALMSPAIKLTLAALRAHATRQLAWAEEASDPATKADHMAKAKGFQERVARIIEQTHATALIAEEAKAAKEAAAKAPEPTPEPSADTSDWMRPRSETEDTTTEPAGEPASEPVDEPTAEPAGEDKPEVRRTPIKIKRGKAA